MGDIINTATIENANRFLDNIEEDNNISIVLAVAHGSHAWGLQNNDSDFDIKAVYAPNNLNQYAKLGSHSETITSEWGEYDVEAWDITKFAELLYESNEQAIDLLRSPITYREQISKEDLRQYIKQEYNPIQLYHDYRSIAKNNYRKYLSDHLTSNRNNTYPILEKQNHGYLVTNTYANKRQFVPDRVVDTDAQEFIHLPFESVDTGDNSKNDCQQYPHQPDTLPTKFETTQTRQTVKRNLTVLRAAMYAQYLRLTGETGTHELPHVDFPTFLTEQAPDHFNDHILELAWELVEQKKNGNNTIVGAQVKRRFAHQPVEIDHTIHASSPPEQHRLNEFIDKALSQTAE